MASREENISALLKMIAFPEDRFFQRRNGVSVPCFQREDSPRIRRFLGSIWSIYVVGKTIMVTSCLRRIRPSRGSLRNIGNFACEHKKRL